MKTEFLTTHALRVEKWSAALFKYPLFKSYLSPFIGPRVKAKGVLMQTSANALLQLKVELNKGQGDKVHFGMIAPLSGEGVTGDNQLEDNEERLDAYEWSIELRKIRNAVRSEGELSDKRVVFNAKMQAKDQLGIWLGRKMDSYGLAALSGVASADTNVAVNAPSANRKWFGGQTAADVLESVANDAAVDSATNNLFGPKVVQAVKRKAMVTEPVLPPIIVDGQEKYLMFIHPYQGKALRASAEWKNSQYYAAVRGKENPLFTGAIGEIDGVILHEWSKIETRYGAGGSTATEYFESGDNCTSGMYVGRALFCGAQAICQAWGKMPYFKTDSFDYQDEWGVAVGGMVGVGKPDFNSEDLGVITVDTAYVPD